MWLCKSIKKRREEKSMKKWTSVQENKTMGTLRLRKKKQMNKIAHVFFTKCSSIFTREVCYQGAVGLATIYTYHISTIFHTHAHLDLIV
jgi:hypothetical protein